MNLAEPHSVVSAAGDRRPHLLMVTHRAPYPLDKGEKIRSWHMLKSLARDYQVHLVCLSDAPLSMESWNQLSAHAAQLAVIPVGRRIRWLKAAGSAMAGRSLTEGLFESAELRRTIAEWTENVPFHAALAVCSSVGGYVADLPIPLKVLDLIDVDSAKWRAYAASARGGRRMAYSIEAQRLAEHERRLAEKFDHVIVTTHTEADLFCKVAGENANVTVVPNGVDLDFFSPTRCEEKPVAVFTGVLNYRPNVEGLEWLVMSVWPAVWKKVPNAELHIVGRDPCALVQRLGQMPGVKVIGPVPDVREYLSGATVAVAPLHIARGVQNKVLEAMAAGRAVLTTPAVARGVSAEACEHLFVEQSVEQWVDRLGDLLAHPQHAWPIAQAARHHVEQTRSWEQCLRPLHRLMGTGPMEATKEQPRSIAA